MSPDSDSFPVIKIDRFCTIVDCNMKACEFTDMDAENLRMRNISEFLNTECGEAGPFPGEANYVLTRFFHFTGLVSDVVIHISSDSTHNELYYLLTIYDVTPDKTTIGSARTESMKTLAGRMAHDLNNILAGILGSLSILREGDYTEIEYNELIDNAEEGVIKARNITDRMLTFSRGAISLVHGANATHHSLESYSDLSTRPDSGRLLLLDDDPFVAGTTIGMLVTLGYIVDVVSDAESVLGKYRKAMESSDPYRIVIMDLTIEGGAGGAETINELLQLDPEAVVILSSGFTGSETMLNYRSLGFKATLSKPYTVRELFEAINTALER